MIAEQIKDILFFETLECLYLSAQEIESSSYLMYPFDSQLPSTAVVLTSPRHHRVISANAPLVLCSVFTFTFNYSQPPFTRFILPLYIKSFSDYHSPVNASYTRAFMRSLDWAIVLSRTEVLRVKTKDEINETREESHIRKAKEENTRNTSKAIKIVQYLWAFLVRQYAKYCRWVMNGCHHEKMVCFAFKKLSSFYL